jgi:hypothetical protein
MMTPGTPTLGIRFDVNRIYSGSYGVECWRIFWEAVDPKDIAGSTLYEGDTSASVEGRENVFCIALQHSSPAPLGYAKAALKHHAEFATVCAPPRFVENAECSREPLILAGCVSPAGDLTGNAWNARPALGEVRRRREQA